MRSRSRPTLADSPVAIESVSQPARSPSASPHGPSLDRLLIAGDYRAAISLLEPNRDPDAQNALGVCLLRTGQIRQAVDVYRRLVLQPGCTWTRPELPDFFKRNFALSLLMAGLPSGALDVLGELQDPLALAAVRMRTAIQSWAKQLPLWRRIDWFINAVEPPGTTVPIDFEPGEFADDVELPRPPAPNDSGRPMRLAA